jgi:hypothetical protein
MYIDPYLTARMRILTNRKTDEHYEEYENHRFVRPTGFIYSQWYHLRLGGGQRVTGPFASWGGHAGLNRVFDAHVRNRGRALNESQETVERPDILVGRYRQMLYFVADKMLGNYKDANDAVERCLVSASTQIPAFECEGAFRSWLVRVLMDEASLILHKKRNERPNM